MLHACFAQIHICFAHTLLHFYTFFGMNLLTRCYSASSMFSTILYFREVVQGIFSELDETKAKVPIFPGAKTESREEMKEGHRMARPTLGAAGWVALGVVWPPPRSSPSPLWTLSS
jgi:hypothetical protein